MKRFLTIFIGGALLVAIIVNAFILIYLPDHRLMRIKAVLGNSQAQSQLGDYYYFSSKDENRLVKARKWYELAAQQNDMSAQTILSMMLFAGKGGDVNEEEASKLLWKTILPKNTGHEPWP